MGKTISEGIFTRASGSEVSPGDFVVADIDMAMAHDGTAPLAIRAFREMGGGEVWDPTKVVFVIDHVVPSSSEGMSSLQRTMREFAVEQKLENFYYGEGVCHQLMPERGHVGPGKLVVGSDSHTCTYGALGAFATGIGSTEMAAVLLSGKLWFKVPETLKFNIEGDLQSGVSPKDVALHIIGEIGSDGATYKAIEYSGGTVREMSVEGRMTLCNMSVEMGAKAGIVQPDSKTIEYLKGRVSGKIEDVTSGDNAEYEKRFEFEVEDLEPQVSCPHSVDDVKSVSEVEGLDVDQAFLGTCTNGRLEDLEAAAQVMDGERVAPGTRMIVAPASRRIHMKALKRGLVSTFLEAGCVICNPGCGPCAGAHQGILSPGEICISSSNRNFKGRMGSKEAKIYLASPQTVAASAIAGEIRNPKA